MIAAELTESLRRHLIWERQRRLLGSEMTDLLQVHAARRRVFE